jgi:hypothetical protein
MAHLRLGNALGPCCGRGPKGAAVSDQNSFGRRKPVVSAVLRSTASQTALSPDAEAFLAKLAAERPAAQSGFAQWMGERRARRTLAWIVGLALLCPGALSFIFNAPAYVSIGLEVMGVVTNVWLRRERRRHLNEIASWEPEG